jgi:cyclic pyranopterin monophosphate synthase
MTEHGPGERSDGGKGLGLTHVDATGAARMVDVGDKEVTGRTATATGVLRTTAAVTAALRDDTVPKGDALGTARVAGIMGAKRTPDLVPLCHPIPLAGVTVDLEVRADEVAITATAKAADRTGVEMEALTAVAVTALAVVDMLKGLDKSVRIADVQIEEKTGGKSGDWRRG